MAENEQREIQVGDKVELKSGFEDVYKKAVAGSVGEVAKKKVDDGFRMVNIKWDKNHWRYNGEADGWTFESHFQLTEKTNIFAALEDPRRFANHLIERAKEEGIEDEQILDAFAERMNEVVNLLAESEGFIVLAARREEHPKTPEEQILVPYVFGGFLEESVMILLESHLVQMGAMAQAEMAQHMIERYKREEEQ